MSRKAKILLVDDEANFLRSLRDTLELEGYEIFTALDGQRALILLERQPVDAVITDIRMPRLTGMELLRAIKSRWPETLVFMLTGYGSIQDAVHSIRMGAENYILKPVDIRDLIRNLHDALKLTRKNKVNPTGGSQLIGRSPAIQKVRDLIQKVAPSELPVLIVGDSGTGKELVANAIFAASRRRKQPFVKINCAALPENLLESELFGYEPGAFTDARRRKKGKLELADAGTLFLDEIGDMPFAMQAKLLRVLEEKRFERLGGNQPIDADFRLISATNQDLEMLIEEERFREDLFFRLNAVQIRMPALREMVEDIPLLIEYFLHHFCVSEGLSEPGFSQEALQILLAYSWPGNVRELRNVVHRAVVLSHGGEITPQHLPSHILRVVQDDSVKAPPLSLEEMERRHIQKVLELTGGNKSKTADLLKIHRDTLYRKLRKYRLE